MHIKLQTVIFDRRVSSLIRYLTKEFSPENYEEERMPLVLLYVIAILHLLFCSEGPVWTENSSLRVLWPRTII